MVSAAGVAVSVGNFGEDRSVADTQKKAASALGNYLSEGNKEPYRRTQYLREIAERLVDLRELFTTDQGDPDWRGQSWEYRQAVSEVYEMAGVKSDQLVTVAAAIRYHIGNVLRDRLDPDDLANIGLTKVSPRERSNERRAKQAEMLARVRGSERLDVLRALAATLAMLQQVDLSDLKTATVRQRRDAKVLLNDIETKARILRERITPE